MDCSALWRLLSVGSLWKNRRLFLCSFFERWKLACGKNYSPLLCNSFIQVEFGVDFCGGLSTSGKGLNL